MLVLPPSFPFGGMENPNMTFATPTVLVGDKSLVSLVSHELAHSWSGNLVTSATWRDIWLNEGFTTYVQGRITEAVYGKVAGRRGGPAVGARAGEGHRHDAGQLRRSWRPIRAASAPTTRCPTWPTTRARGSCARWSSASAARRSTRT